MTCFKSVQLLFYKSEDCCGESDRFLRCKNLIQHHGAGLAVHLPQQLVASSNVISTICYRQVNAELETERLLVHVALPTLARGT